MSSWCTARSTAHRWPTRGSGAMIRSRLTAPGRSGARPRDDDDEKNAISHRAALSDARGGCFKCDAAMVFGSLRSLAVLQIEVSLLRFQSPCPRRRRPSRWRDAMVEGAGPRRARGAERARRDVYSRRHAVAHERDRRRGLKRVKALWDRRPRSRSPQTGQANLSEASRFAALAKAGVNRVSLGVRRSMQRRSASSAVSILPRGTRGHRHGAPALRRAIPSTDLCPARQTAEAWAGRDRTGAGAGCEHLSLYKLTSSAARFIHRPAPRRVTLPTKTRRRRCRAEPARWRPRPARYESSNHAVRGVPAANLIYWRTGLVGVGPGRMAGSRGGASANRRRRDEPGWRLSTRGTRHGGDGPVGGRICGGGVDEGLRLARHRPAVFAP